MERTGTVTGMITFLRGVAVGQDTVLVGGVGYGVVPATPLVDGSEVDLPIRTVWGREGEMTLYAFATEADRAGFDALRAIAGIGPAVALSVIRAVGAAGLAQAIADSDADLLARAKGVSAKTGAKILAGIDRDKIPISADATPDLARRISEVLAGLGYDHRTAGSAAVAAVAADPHGPFSELVRDAISRSAGAAA